jgi:mRNA-degrading endonuclease RelE of RelBE toxin-antitoxin system
MYEVRWQNKAVRQFEKIKEHSIRKNIKDAVSELEKFPHCRQIKALTNHEHGFRLRVGRYRILFDVWDALHIISIEEVKKRDEHTY